MSKRPPTPAELRAWRTRLGLTQSDVLEIAGSTAKDPRRTWQSWEAEGGEGSRPVPWYVRAVMEYVERSVGR